jgi:hypothetical protein
MRGAGARIPRDSVEVETFEVSITSQALFRGTIWELDHNSPPYFSFSGKNGKAAFKRALLYRGGKSRMNWKTEIMTRINHKTNLASPDG